MAKAVRLAGELTVGEALDRLVPTLLARALDREAATRAGDPEEGIHRMRVATKRAREALRLFSPVLRGRGVKKHLAAFEALNDALGEVRDRDVLALLLREVADEADGARDALERAFAAERAKAFEALIEALDHFRDGREAETILERVARRALHEDGPLAAYAEEVVEARWSRLRERFARASESPTPDSLHALRIAAKKARYGIEPFVDVLRGDAKEAERNAEALQAVLGAIHDHDLLVARIERALFEAPADERPAFAALLDRVERARRERFLELAALRDRLAAVRGRYALA